MRQRFFIMTMILIVGLNHSISQGQLLVENFDYPIGTELNNYNWIVRVSSANPITITSPGLEYAEYSLSGIGNAALMPKSGEEVQKSFAEQTNGSVYVSFMVNVGDASPTPAGLAFLYFGPQNIARLSESKFLLYCRKNENNQIGFGISKGSSVYCTDYTYALNTTYLIVAKYQFNTTSNEDDSLHLWINPPTNGPEPSADRIQGVGSDATGFSEIILTQRNEEPALIIDGIVVSTAWPLVDTAVSRTDIHHPEFFRIVQNYPNPFNLTTMIRLDLLKSGPVDIMLFDTGGRTIRTVLNKYFETGSHKIEIDAGDLPTGIYFCRLTVGTHRSSMKMLLVK